jgi:hypothetical protein
MAKANKQPQSAAPAANNAGVDDALFPSAEDFNEAEGIWNGGQEEAAKGNPQGTFQFEITVAELTRAASSDRLQIHYRLRILSPGQYHDIEVNKYDGLGSQAQAAITQRQLQRLGIDTTKVTLKTLPAHLVDLVGLKVVATAKQNGEFYNINFVKPLTDAEAQGMAAPANPATGATFRGGGGAAPAAAGAKKRF